MIDKDSKFLAILTAVGEAKLANAIGLGLPWLLTEMGVGDANNTDPIPDRMQTALIHEQRRAPLNQLRDDEANPGLLIAEQIIPADVGGWWVREVGLYDVDGDLVAVANCAPSYKPLLEQGSGRTQVVRMTFVVSSTANVVLKIDPSVVLATRQYVDDRTYAYVPVQQGGGKGQADLNKIFLGFGTNNRLKATVDDTDLGSVVFDSNTASEEASGVIPLATLKAVQLGDDDTSAVTPKKLRLGFSISLGQNGHVAFPTWMLGLIFQWGVVRDIPAASSVPGSIGPTLDITLPIVYPTAALVVAGSMNFTTMSTTSAFTPGAVIVSNAVVRFQNNYTASAGIISWWSVGC